MFSQSKLLPCAVDGRMPRAKIARAKGFTLIELMIVVAIIGILAAIAVPNFGRLVCRAKQGEAKTILNQLFVAEESYRVTNEQYFGGGEGALESNIGMKFDPSAIRRYTFSAVSGGSTFEGSAMAVAGKGMDSDEWSINNQKVLVWETSTPACL